MLYATIDKQRWDSLPAEWDKVQDMFKYLHKMTYTHQLTFEVRMFNREGSYPYQCTLVRWETQMGRLEKKREVLLETSDPAQMEAALIMLIGEAEPAFKEAAAQRVSMIP